MTTPATGRSLTSACNGVTKLFSCPVFQSASELKVFLLDDPSDANADGIALTQDFDYTLSGSGPAGTAKITTIATYPAGKYIRRWRQTSLAQTADYVPNSGFPAATQEAALDRLSLVDEEAQSDEGAAVRGNPGDVIAPLPRASSRSNKFMQWAANGRSLLLLSVSDLATALVDTLRPLLATVAKGDPGGNAMALGLFIAAATHLGGGGFAIPVGTDLVKTSGYSVRGIGPADYIYDAAVDNAFIAAYPRAAFMSTNGRGFRLAAQHFVDIQSTGAVGDCTAFGAGTDNSPAIMAAAAYATNLVKGSSIVIPHAAGLFRCASTLRFTSGTAIFGQGYGENPGTVNGVSTAPPKNYRGAVLVFDADVAGMQFVAYTDHAANAPVTQYESSLHSVMQNLMLLSPGGVGITGHGVDVKVGVDFTNVRISGFAGNGLNLVANTAGANQYGNADSSTFISITCDGNKLHGLFCDGNDANVLHFFGGSFRNNGGCGTLDVTIVGNNSFYTTHYATNNKSHPTNSGAGYSAAQRAQVLADAPCLSDNLTGSAVTYRGKDYSGNDIGNVGLYSNCYVEGGSGSKARLRHNTIVTGGFMAQVAIRHAEYTAQTWGFFELRGPSDFYQQSNGFKFWDGGITVSSSDPASTSIPKLTLKPTGAAVSQLAMLGLGGSTALGLDLSVVSGTAYGSCDAFVLRNAAQNSTHVTIDGSGIRPGADNLRSSGSAAFRWSTVYAGTGTINTSDARHKTAIEKPSDALLDAWAEVEWQSFKFKDAVKAKGKDGARLHFGLVAQRVRDTFAKHGFDGFALGLLCHDQWDDEYEQKFGERTVVIEEHIPEPHTKRGYRVVKRKERQTVPLFDEKGEPVMRLVRKAGDAFGVRYVEALVLDAALQGRTNQRQMKINERLEQRLAALEARSSAA